MDKFQRYGRRGRRRVNVRNKGRESQMYICTRYDVYNDIRVRGSEVGDVESTSRGARGGISKGNDVRGNVRAEKKPRAWRGPA
ncbi:hypothetical protein VN97_g10694 [Penicillium thymicola]|uniref:Uncharacterized protein n=1 Tax=Penicillium thymicola TaxID=293382 RepID=A0AAI9T9M2_PENTH|nr:hypothetical protein VN97_g10694 [Penicillium thymicola]